jgi:hypothetical protein
MLVEVLKLFKKQPAEVARGIELLAGFAALAA